MTKSRPISPRRWSTPGQLDADRHGPNLVRELPFSSLTIAGALAPSATPSSTLLPFVLFLSTSIQREQGWSKIVPVGHLTAGYL